MKQTFRTILPTTANRSSRRTHTPPRRLPPKRKPVTVACELCRKRKLRCDGQRPGCTPCRDRRNVCVYRPDEPSKELTAEFNAQLDTLKQENLQLRQLYTLLGKLPRVEVNEVLARMHATSDPIAMLRFARELSVSTLPAQGPDVIPVEDERSNPRLRAIDLRALVGSSLRVSARPWTTVASDGIVSDLISSFFRWDDLFFFPFIDREAFLQDMRSDDVENAAYCSPFLVNAICASRCVSLDDET